MYIPVYLFYFLCLSIILCGLTLIYRSWTIEKKNRVWHWFTLLSVFPLGFFTPNIYKVTDCGVYSQQVLLFPKGDYQLGMHCYVENNASTDLVLESIIYGRDRDDSLGNDVTIAAHSSKKVDATEVHYIFKEAPYDILINASRRQELRYRLTCDPLDGY